MNFSDMKPTKFFFSFPSCGQRVQPKSTSEHTLISGSIKGRMFSRQSVHLATVTLPGHVFMKLIMNGILV